MQAVVGHVANYVYSYVFYDLPISSATFAPFTFVIPKGTVLNPDDRAATSCSVMVCTGVMSACANTFAKMMFGSPGARPRGGLGVQRGQRGRDRRPDAVGPAVRGHGRLLDQHRGHGRAPGLGGA